MTYTAARARQTLDNNSKGVWTVETAGSTYTFDMNKRDVSLVPGAAAGRLRRGYARVALVKILALEVGGPAVFIVTGLAEVGPTRRISTTVLSIIGGRK
jgi:hypothetical protein